MEEALAYPKPKAFPSQKSLRKLNKPLNNNISMVDNSSKTEAQKWFDKAKSDLKHAHSSLTLKDYDWVQTAAQQSAEKALKAGLYLQRVRINQNTRIISFSQEIKCS